MLVLVGALRVEGEHSVSGIQGMCRDRSMASGHGEGTR